MDKLNKRGWIESILKVKTSLTVHTVFCQKTGTSLVTESCIEFQGSRAILPFLNYTLIWVNTEKATPYIAKVKKNIECKLFCKNTFLRLYIKRP